MPTLVHQTVVFTKVTALGLASCQLSECGTRGHQRLGQVEQLQHTLVVDRDAAIGTGLEDALAHAGQRGLQVGALLLQHGQRFMPDAGVHHPHGVLERLGFLHQGLQPVQQLVQVQDTIGLAQHIVAQPTAKSARGQRLLGGINAHQHRAPCA
ncbi:hypothetical protein D3C71_1357080 [compost metagenome]